MSEEIVLEADNNGVYTPSKTLPKAKRKVQNNDLFSLSLKQREDESLKADVRIGKEYIMPTLLGVLVAGVGGYFLNRIVKGKLKNLKSQGIDYGN